MRIYLNASNGLMETWYMTSTNPVHKIEIPTDRNYIETCYISCVYHSNTMLWSDCLFLSLSFTLITLMGLALEMSLTTSPCDSHLSSPLPEALWEDDSVIRWIAFLHKQMSAVFPTSLLYSAVGPEAYVISEV